MKSIIARALSIALFFGTIAHAQDAEAGHRTKHVQETVTNELELVKSLGSCTDPQRC